MQESYKESAEVVSKRYFFYTVGILAVYVSAVVIFVL